MPKGFRAVRSAVVAALESGSYLHVSRGDIEVKNLLAIGEVGAGEVIDIIHSCDGSHYSSSPHHAVPAIEVHVLKRLGWYIKFYFIEPQTWFISVHQ